MSTKELDEYCEKIFGYLAFNFDKPHYFNRLKEELNESGIKISKPTLIAHLRHLKSQKIIKKKKEGKQKIAISLNYEQLINVEFYKNFNDILKQLLEEKEMFNALTIEKKVNLVSACLYVIETNRLKYDILKTIEPEKKFQHSISFQFIKNTLEQYRGYLLKTCLGSQDNAKEALQITEELEKNWKEAVLEELK